MLVENKVSRKTWKWSIADGAPKETRADNTTAVNEGDEESQNSKISPLGKKSPTHIMEISSTRARLALLWAKKVSLKKEIKSILQ